MSELPHPQPDIGESEPRDRSLSRLSFSLESRTPVWVRSDLGLQQGMARNMTPSGMLIELAERPPIGGPLEVTLSGRGGFSASDTMVFIGEVRHHLAWEFSLEAEKAGRAQFRAIWMRILGVEEKMIHPERKPS